MPADPAGQGLCEPGPGPGLGPGLGLWGPGRTGNESGPTGAPGGPAETGPGGGGVPSEIHSFLALCGSAPIPSIAGTYLRKAQIESGWFLQAGPGQQACFAGREGALVG